MTNPVATIPDAESTALPAEALLPRLAALADARAATQFGDLVDAIDWPSRPPDDLLRVIHLAVYLDLSRLAMRLAALGGQLFPAHARLQEAARVIRPPVVLGTSPADGSGISIRESQRWIRQHAHMYRGQWIAVRDGQLLGAAPTLDELWPLPGEDEEVKRTLVIKVL